MILLDEIQLAVFIFLPLLAAVFVFLVPEADFETQSVFEKFFSICGTLLICYLFLAMTKGEITTAYNFDVPIFSKKISIILRLTKSNVVFYLLSAIVLTISAYFPRKNNIRSNLHQLYPFLLTFSSFIIFTQNTLSPLLILGNFIIFFVVSASLYEHRGSAIFFTGILFVSLDMLCLISLQNLQSTDMLPYREFLSIFLLLPGLARMGIFLFNPIYRALLEGGRTKDAFIINSYMQLTGFYTLSVLKKHVFYGEQFFYFLLALILLHNILVILYLKRSKNSKMNLNAQMTFFTLTSSILLLGGNIHHQWYGFSLFFSALFSFALLSLLSAKKTLHSGGAAKSEERFSGLFFLGIPGFGVGTSLWLSGVFVLKSQDVSVYFALGIFFIIYILFTYQLFKKIFERNYFFDYQKKKDISVFFSSTNPNKQKLFFSVFVSAVIPYLTYFVQGLRG